MIRLRKVTFDLYGCLFRAHSQALGSHRPSLAWLCKNAGTVVLSEPGLAKLAQEFARLLLTARLRHRSAAPHRSPLHAPDHGGFASSHQRVLSRPASTMAVAFHLVVCSSAASEQAEQAKDLVGGLGRACDR